MILSGPEIVSIIRRTRASSEAGYPAVLPRIVIDPFVEENVGPNSVDVRLGDKLMTYVLAGGWVPSFLTDRRPEILDSRRSNETQELRMEAGGFVMLPGVLYLGTTVERTETEGVVPWLDGRSSVGRLGLSVHVTAGRGDDGFKGHWTLEMTCVHPVMVYPGMRIAQISFFKLCGERKPYKGKYQDQAGSPVASKLHEDEKSDA